MKSKAPGKLLANNPKSRHDYFLEEYIECGIELVGTEVKSLRQGKCSIKEAWIKIEGGQVYICQMNISPYEHGNLFNRDPIRQRKLLLHKEEILKLSQKVREKGYTLVPVEVYLKGQHVKVEIALARGKKNYDKRQDIKERDQKREALRTYKAAALKI